MISNLLLINMRKERLWEKGLTKKEITYPILVLETMKSQQKGLLQALKLGTQKEVDFKTLVHLDLARMGMTITKIYMELKLEQGREQTLEVHVTQALGPMIYQRTLRVE